MSLDLKKILVIRYDALGDTLVTLPFINELKNKFDEAKISVVVSERGKEAVSFLSFLKNVYVLNMDDKYEKRKIFELIKKEKFDISFNVTEKMIGYTLPFMAGIKKRVGFDPGFTQPIKSLLCKLLLTDRASYKNNPNKSIGLHEVERQFLLFKKLGFDMSPKAYKIPISEKDKKKADSLLPENKKYIAVHLSNKWFSNGWNIYWFYELIKKLRDIFQDFEFFFTAGSAERDIAKDIKSHFQDVKVFENLSFGEWSAVFSKAISLLTMDTSASHLSAGLGIPSVVVFEDKYFKHTSERWHPWKAPCIIVKREKMAVKEIEDSTEKLDSDIIQGLKRLLLM